MDTNRIWVLIGKKLAEEATPAELAELANLMGNTKDYPLTLAQLEAIWQSRPPALPVTAINPQQLEDKWARLQKRMKPVANPEVAEKENSYPIKRAEGKRYFKLQLIAACLALIGVFTFYLLAPKILPGTRNQTQVIMAPGKGIKVINLPDGTKVWLNAGSHLTYKDNFGKERREVILRGEAYFEVVKDKQHPFLVTTSSLQLRVLGTAFNVRSFEQEITSEASLVHGSIEVSLLQSPDKKITLKPSEKLTVRNNWYQKNKKSNVAKSSGLTEIPLITLSQVNYTTKSQLPEEAQWIEQKLVFDAETLAEIALKMERYYQIQIIFKDLEVKKLRFTGSFQEETVPSALKALQSSSYFSYTLQGNKVIISK